MAEPSTESPPGSLAKASLFGVVAAMANTLGHEGFPRGDLAALRRLNVECPIEPAFWRLANSVPQNYQYGDDSQQRWALILQGMALMVPKHFDPKQPVGSALAQADYSEQRLARLLNAKGRMFRAMVPRLCRYLANKAQPLDWHELAKLILSEGRNEKAAENVRLKIARYYYAALSRSDR